MRRSRSETVYISERHSPAVRFGRLLRLSSGCLETTLATGARRLRSPYYCRAWQESLIFGRFAAMADALECSDIIDFTWSSESLCTPSSSRVRGRLSPTRS